MFKPGFVSGDSSIQTSILLLQGHMQEYIGNNICIYFLFLGPQNISTTLIRSVSPHWKDL